MEALVAVGLAGNVVQFVQFSGQLIAEASRIRKSGTPSSLPDLRNLSHALMAQADTIYRCLKSNSATLAEEDQVGFPMSSFSVYDVLADDISLAFTRHFTGMSKARPRVFTLLGLSDEAFFNFGFKFFKTL